MMFKVRIHKIRPAWYRQSGADLGGPPGPSPLFLHVKNCLEPYICPYANTCLKISSCIDLKCLLYVCATVKIQFASTILNHTPPPLGHYALLARSGPLCENSESAPGHACISDWINKHPKITVHILLPVIRVKIPLLRYSRRSRL